MPRGVFPNGNKGGFKKGHPKPKKAYSWRKGNIPWNTGTKGIVKPSSGSFKKGHKGYWLGKKQPKEAILKRTLKQSGKNHYNWKGGISTENDRLRHTFEVNLWKKAVLERDNFTCQKYGIKGGILNAHHINNFADFPELRTSIENGITLSVKAHKEFHKKYGKRNNTKEQLQEFLI